MPGYNTGPQFATLSDRSDLIRPRLTSRTHLDEIKLASGRRTTEKRHQPCIRHVLLLTACLGPTWHSRLRRGVRSAKLSHPIRQAWAEGGIVINLPFGQLSPTTWVVITTLLRSPCHLLQDQWIPDKRKEAHSLQLYGREEGNRIFGGTTGDLRRSRIA